MKIAVDIDDTLSVVDREGYISRYLKESGLPFRVVFPRAGKLQDVCNWTKDDAKRFVREGGEAVFKDAVLREGVNEALAAWRAAGHEVIVLTSRNYSWFDDPVKLSRDWLEKWEVPYDGLVVGADDKGRYCEEHGISVLVDNDVDNCLSAQRRGVKAVLAVIPANRAQRSLICYGGESWREIDAIVRNF